MRTSVLACEGKQYVNVVASSKKTLADEMFYPGACFYSRGLQLVGQDDLTVGRVAEMQGSLKDEDVLVVVSGACDAADGLDEVLRWSPFLVTKTSVYMVSRCKRFLRNPFPHGALEVPVLDIAEAKALLG